MDANDIPARYPPPFDPESVIGKPILSADKQLPVGVLIVGAGPAGLACAIRLMQLLEKEPELKQSLGDFPVAVLEKGKYPGAHLLSGAVINPIAFRKLFPNLKDSDFPFYGPVEKESVYFLTPKKAFPIPVPPTMKNHGNFSASLAKVGAWMAGKAEELGVTLLPQTSAVKQGLSNIEDILLEGHLGHCLVNQIKKGQTDQATQEILKVYKLKRK